MILRLLAFLVLLIPGCLWAQDVSNCKCVYINSPTPTKTRTPTRTPVASKTPTPVTTATKTPVPPTPVPTATPTPAGAFAAVKAQWESRMLTYGQQHCEYIKTLPAGLYYNPNGGPFDPYLGAVYYDGSWVFWQIFDYTGSSYWYDCAQAAEVVYRDRYARHVNGGVAGWQNFGHGLFLDWLKSPGGDLVSKDTIQLLATNCAFCVSNQYNDSPSTGLPGVLQSRENAYVLMAYLNQERTGTPLNPRAMQLVNNALGHVDSWFVSRTAPYVRGFMVGLTAQALIEYRELHRDDRILGALIIAGEELRASSWLPAEKCFAYTDRQTDSGGREAACDLNLLIAPLYAYLYHTTGAQKYRDWHDEAFAGAVAGAWLGNGKQFMQSYRWSFTGLRWRGQ